MKDLVERRFEEWTQGLGEVEARIRVFEGVRDIPYRIVPEIRNAQDGPVAILEHGCGSCTPKHFLLGRFFEKLGLAVRFVTFPFRWDDPDTDYPAELRFLARGLPVEYHLALAVEIEGRRVTVDATWDPPLARAGLPVNEGWDGASECRLAVKAIERIEHRDAAERDAYVTMKKRAWSSEDHRRALAFYEAFNRWVDEVRSQGARKP